jgi:predicted transcriptional regulator
MNNARKLTAVRLPVKHIQQLAALAKERDLDLSDMIRQAVREFCEREQQDSEQPA